MNLRHSNDDYRIAGVFGGLTKYLGWGSTRLRIVWVLATIFTAFAGVVIYIGLWFLMPKAPPVPQAFESPPLQPWKKAV